MAAWRAGCVAGVFVLSLAVLAAGVQARPASAYYVPVTEAARGGAFVTGREVDFGALLAAMGETRPVDARSVRVVQVSAGGELRELPFSLGEGDPMVAWPVEAAPVGTPLQFRITVRVGGATSRWSPERDPSLAPNLQSGGDFEGGPPCWAPADAGELDRAVAARGRASLKAQGGRLVLGPTPASPLGVAVDASLAYRVSVSLKSSGRGLQWLRVAYRDREGRLLDRDAMTSLLRARKLAEDPPAAALPPYDWTPVSFVVRPRPGTAFLALELGPGTAPGSEHGDLWVDDLRLEPLRLPAATVLVDAASGRRATTDAPDVPGLRRFDFGGEASPLLEGFTPVSASASYDRSRGFGFRGGAPVNVDFTYPLDPLAVDGVRSDDGRPYTFLVDLPDGEYRVWLCSGANSGGWYELRRPYSIALSGGEVQDVAIDARTYFRDFYFRWYYELLASDDALPVDVYERYFRAAYREATLTARVTDGQLAVTVTSGRTLVKASTGFLNALVVYPAEHEAAGQRYVAWLRQERARLGAVPEIVAASTGPVEAPTADDVRRGYGLYTRPYTETLRPSDRPVPGARLGPLRVLAYAGEWQAAALCVEPLRDLGEVTVAPGALRGPGGREIPAAAIDVSVVRYLASRVQATARVYALEGYERRGLLVLPGRRASARAGVAREFVLTVNVPADLPQGTYRGPVTVTPEQGPPTTIELEATVLPLTLIPPPGWHTSFRYTLPSSFGRYVFPEMIAAQRAMHVAELRDMKRFRQTSAMAQLRGAWVWADGRPSRLTTGCVQSLPDGSLAVRPERVERWFRWFQDELLADYAQAGLAEIPLLLDLVPQRGPVNEAAYAAWQQIVQALYQRTRQLPGRFVFDFGGEWSNGGLQGGQNGLRAYSWAKQALPGVLTGSTFNGPHDLLCLGYVDLVSLRATLFSDALVREVRRKGGQVYLYGHSERFANGLYLWRMGARGNYLTEYYIHEPHGAPFNDFDSNLSDFAWTHALPGPDGPVDTLRMYSRAEGFQDALTLYTLQALCETARSGGGEAAKALADSGERFLADLRARVPESYAALEASGATPDAATLDRIRLEAATRAYALQQALAEGGQPSPRPGAAEIPSSPR